MYWGAPSPPQVELLKGKDGAAARVLPPAAEDPLDLRCGRVGFTPFVAAAARKAERPAAAATRPRHALVSEPLADHLLQPAKPAVGVGRLRIVPVDEVEV